MLKDLRYQFRSFCLKYQNSSIMKSIQLLLNFKTTPDIAMNGSAAEFTTEM